MIKRTLSLVMAAVAALMVLAWSSGTWAQAQPYPNKPIRLVVPFPPGSSTDILARAAASLLAERLNGSIVVENSGGGGGLVGLSSVSRAQPDGYTLLFTEAGSLVIQPHLRNDLPYDPVNGFAPIAKVGDIDVIFAVHPKVTANNLKELIEYAKANPDKLSYSSGGNGTTPHIAGEMLMQRTGMKMQHIPYKGGAPATVAALSGEVDMVSSAATSIMPLVNGAKLKAIAIASPQRRAFAPDVPTVMESGFADFAASAWFGMLAPNGVPAAIVERLRSEMSAVAGSEEFRKRSAPSGLVPDVVSGDDFARLIVRERAKWGEVIRQAGIKLEAP